MLRRPFCMAKKLSVCPARTEIRFKGLPCFCCFAWPRFRTFYARMRICACGHSEQSLRSEGETEKTAGRRKRRAGMLNKKRRSAKYFCAPPLFACDQKRPPSENEFFGRRPQIKPFSINAALSGNLLVFDAVAVFAGGHVFDFFKGFQKRTDFVVSRPKGDFMDGQVCGL